MQETLRNYLTAGDGGLKLDKKNYLETQIYIFIICIFYRAEEGGGCIENVNEHQEITSHWLRLSFQVVKENIFVQNKSSPE